jgi:hypothetical protein
VAAEIDRVLRFASGASWKPDPRLRGRVWAHDPMIAAWASYKSRGTEPVVVPIGRTGWYASAGRAGQGHAVVQRRGQWRTGLNLSCIE